LHGGDVCVKRIEERNKKVISYSSNCSRVRFGMCVHRELRRETQRLSFILLAERRDRREKHKGYLLYFPLQESERESKRGKKLSLYFLWQDGKKESKRERKRLSFVVHIVIR
jgi:hypothetical protein